MILVWYHLPSILGCRFFILKVFLTAHHSLAQIHWNAYLVAEETGKTVPYGLLSIIKGGDKPVLEEIKMTFNFKTPFFIPL